MLETNTTSKESIFFVVNLKRVTEKFEALARRAKRLNVEAPSFEKVGEHTEWEVCQRGPDGEPQMGWVSSRNTFYDLTGATRTVHHLVLRGAAVVKISGWSFMASIDHSMGDDVSLIHSSPQAREEKLSFSAYAERGSICEHCGHNRQRKQTFILRHEDGRMIQVGSSCLKDFLGHFAANAASEAELVALAGEALFDSSDDMPARPSQFDLVEFLAWTAREIREHGWVSRAQARDRIGGVATADRTLVALHCFYQQK
jgi:hypothetical protein